MRNTCRWLCVGLTCAALALAGATPAAAQYFGQSKVQYKTFDFQVLKTDHFDIYFYPVERQAAEMAARLAERWYARYHELLGHTLSGRQPLILYASHADFEQTNVLTGGIGEGTGGVTEGVRRRIVIPLAGPMSETDHVIGHELVHAFQYDIGTGGRSQQSMSPGGGLERLPLWFVEGMAEYLSLGPNDPNTAMWMRDAVARDRLPKDLNDPDYFPYRWGQAWWAYVSGRWGDEVVRKLLVNAKATGNVGDAIKATLGIDQKELLKEWRAALTDLYSKSDAVTRDAAAYGRRLGAGNKEEDPKKSLISEMDVSPAVSPDGRTVAFMSARSLFSIDVYLADVATGKVLRHVTSTAYDPHVSSLQFIRSAGAWSPDGRQLVVPEVKEGNPALRIVDPSSGAVLQEIALPELQEVFNPAWSPDGNSIAFSAITGGMTDLFVYDLQAKGLRRLTRDPFADLQPVWSPDGRQIAFVTDRFTSKLDELQFGENRLAIINADGSGLRELPTVRRGKAISPQWSEDGHRVYFLSDANGATNIYAVSPDGENLVEITNLRTGISGITASSPALAAATKANRLVFSAYERDSYRLYAIDADTALAGFAPPETPQVIASLPPLERRSTEVTKLVDNPAFGLEPPKQFPETPYKARLGLDAVGQPSIGAGVDQFGVYGGGGVAFSWSDMLGDHNLTTVAQLNSNFTNNFSLKDLGGVVQYVNLKHRWNWGVEAAQMPYLTGGIGQAIVDNGASTNVVEQRFLLRQTDQEVGAIAAYPFSRAQRVEFSGGVRRISLDQQLETTVYDYYSGQVLSDETQNLAPTQALNLLQTSAALVYDNAFYGATSPVAGQRYRFQVTPLMGTINVQNVLADYRRYFMPAQFYTIAVRAMHYGRYGRDAENQLLSPLFLGYPDLVRGYDVGSFTASECPAQGNACPVFDRLVGSRLLVGNVEMRFPLFRPMGLSRRMYGWGGLPLELALFADTGVAWDKGETPRFFGAAAGDFRRPVSSAGAAIRVNVLGFAVAQFDLVHPFDRPQKGWVFQFSLVPGF